jgi:hypothetical protein
VPETTPTVAHRSKRPLLRGSTRIVSTNGIVAALASFAAQRGREGRPARSSFAAHAALTDGRCFGRRRRRSGGPPSRPVERRSGHRGPLALARIHRAAGRSGVRGVGGAVDRVLRSG